TLNSVSDAEINLSELSDGMYFMNINSDKGTGSYKIIKK
ncbi:T9SS type A sorting domain-containing protein, partial [Flavobacterium sp. MK4S-17]